MQISKGIFTKQVFQNRELSSDQTPRAKLKGDTPASKVLNSTLQVQCGPTLTKCKVSKFPDNQKTLKPLFPVETTT